MKLSISGIIRSIFQTNYEKDLEHAFFGIFEGLEFDQAGDLLATVDKDGRVVIFREKKFCVFSRNSQRFLTPISAIRAEYESNSKRKEWLEDIMMAFLGLSLGYDLVMIYPV